MTPQSPSSPRKPVVWSSPGRTALGRALPKRDALAAALCLVSLPLLVSSGSAEEDDSLLLRYKLKQGDSARYQVRYAALAVAALPGMPGSAASSDLTMRARGEMELGQRVVRAAENGELQLDTQVLRGEETMTSDGEEEVLKLPRSKVTTRVTSRGVILETLTGSPAERTEDTGLLGSMSAGDFFQGANIVPFPEGPAKVGHQWEDEMEVALDKGDTMRLHTSSKLLAWVTCLGKQCAKIATSYKGAQEFTEDLEGMTMTAAVNVNGQITGYYTVADGLLVYSEDSVSAVIQTQTEGADQMEGVAAEMLAEMDMSTTIRIRANAKTVLRQ